MRCLLPAVDLQYDVWTLLVTTDYDWRYRASHCKLARFLPDTNYAILHAAALLRWRLRPSIRVEFGSALPYAFL